MEKEPTTAPGADVTEKVTTTEEATVPTEAESSSSKEETTDYDALIQAEKDRKPDPDKAKEAFLKREEKRKREEVQEPESHEDELDKPMTRREAEEFLSRRSHQIVAETQVERIGEIAKEFAESEGQARYIVEIHKNRVFPEGMSLRDQLKESFFIANGQRMAAKNVELARKVVSKETVSKDTASTHHDPQDSGPQKIAGDVAAALRRSGFEYDNSSKVYVRKLPNGKKLYRDPVTNRTWM